MSKSSIAIIGMGKLGRVLAAALAKSGFNVDIMAKNIADGNKVVAQFPSDWGHVRANANSNWGDYDVIFITTQDGKIADTAAQIAAQGGFGSGQLFVHCSGALPANVLQLLTTEGAMIAACHPLQTFPDMDSGLRALPGTPWYCEGSMLAIAKIAPLIEQLGGTIIPIDARQKAGYHAAVCMAANHMAALIAAAEMIAQKSGLGRDQFRASLAPIMRTMLDNTIAMGPRAAITGPARRGDDQTIAGHIDAIKNADEKNGQELAQIYQLLTDFIKRHLA